MSKYLGFIIIFTLLAFSYCGKKDTTVQPETAASEMTTNVAVVKMEGEGGIFTASLSISTNYAGFDTVLAVDIIDTNFWNLILRAPQKGRIILKAYDQNTFFNTSGGFILRYMSALRMTTNFNFVWSSSRPTFLPVTIEAWNIYGQTIQSETVALTWVKDETAENYFTATLSGSTNSNSVATVMNIAVLKAGFESMIIEAPNWNELSNVASDSNFRVLYRGMVLTNRGILVSKPVFSFTFTVPQSLTVPISIRAVDADGLAVQSTNLTVLRQSN